jgi:hypothetical protein
MLHQKSQMLFGLTHLVRAVPVAHAQFQDPLVRRVARQREVGLGRDRPVLGHLREFLAWYNMDSSIMASRENEWSHALETVHMFVMTNVRRGVELPRLLYTRSAVDCNVARIAAGFRCRHITRCTLLTMQPPHLGRAPDRVISLPANHRYTVTVRSVTHTKCTEAPHAQKYGRNS